MKHLTSIIYLLCLLFLASCTSFDPTESLQYPAEMTTRFSMYSEEGETNGKWWKNFDNNGLDQLIEKALDDNFSIKEAWARLAQAKYEAIKAGDENFPQLDGQLGGSTMKAKSKGLSQTSTTEWSIGFLASYEVDLWGRVRANQESTNLKTKASREDLRAAIMTVTGEITETWVQLISNKKQQLLFAEQLSLQEKLLDLIKKRFPLARSTALEIYQQQQTIESIKNSMIPLAENGKSLIRKIALLTGKNSIPTTLLPPPAFPLTGSLPDIGLPADLLANRPDIRAAGLRMKSAEWQIAAAKADRLPALKLTASHSFEDENFTSVFDNWLLNLAANLTGPIFDGNRRRAEVERIKAIADETIATYGATVFTAIKEVEDALAAEAQATNILESLEIQLVLSNKTIREATRRYLNGSSDFLYVLQEELNILKIKQGLVVSHADMLIARIELYKALGGSWADDYLN